MNGCSQHAATIGPRLTRSAPQGCREVGLPCSRSLPRALRLTLRTLPGVTPAGRKRQPRSGMPHGTIASRRGLRESVELPSDRRALAGLFPGVRGMGASGPALARHPAVRPSGGGWQRGRLPPPWPPMDLSTHSVRSHGLPRPVKSQSTAGP